MSDIVAFPVDTPAMARLRRNKTRVRRQRFVKGPISWQEVCVAANAHPRGLELFLALRMQADTARTSTVRPSPGLLEEIGIGRETRRRALAALEQAGLLSIEQTIGRAPMVRLVSLDDSKC